MKTARSMHHNRLLNGDDDAEEKLQLSERTTSVFICSWKLTLRDQKSINLSLGTEICTGSSYAKTTLKVEGHKAGTTWPTKLGQRIGTCLTRQSSTRRNERPHFSVMISTHCRHCLEFGVTRYLASMIFTNNKACMCSRVLYFLRCKPCSISVPYPSFAERCQ